MKSLIVSLCLVVVAVDSVAINKLKTTPQGINVAKWNEYMGRWYLYAVIHSCSWSGAVKFTDWTTTYMMDNSSDLKFTTSEHWRKDGSCSNTRVKGTVTSPGCYNVVDQVGDLWSSKAIIVDAGKRFKDYNIRWGCIKYIGDVCADYWVSVKTRHPNPGQKTIHKINRTLAVLWDTSLAEMAMVPQTNPCDNSGFSSNPATRQTWRKY